MRSNYMIDEIDYF